MGHRLEVRRSVRARRPTVIRDPALSATARASDDDTAAPCRGDDARQLVNGMVRDGRQGRHRRRRPFGGGHADDIGRLPLLLRAARVPGAAAGNPVLAAVGRQQLRPGGDSLQRRGEREWRRRAAHRLHHRQISCPSVYLNCITVGWLRSTRVAGVHHPPLDGSLAGACDAGSQPEACWRIGIRNRNINCVLARSCIWWRACVRCMRNI